MAPPRGDGHVRKQPVFLRNVVYTHEMMKKKERENPEALMIDSDACYAAMASHDSRFDGRFFCGVSSTRIYCRPVCRVKLPRRENCTFFVSAAAAERSGYRPCLKCRPELAPGLAPVDAADRLAGNGALMMEEDVLADRKLPDLAEILGISDRHLRRVFLARYGVAPVEYLQTKRLLLAKSLLTDTGLPITDVAMAAGFGSIRRFNDLFKKRYRLTPGRFRKNGGEAGAGSDTITLSLGYRPPYDWESLTSFLAVRAVPGVESVIAGAYRRTVALKKGGEVIYGWISVSPGPKGNTLSVTMASALLPVLSGVLARVRHLFDLDSNPMEIAERLRTLNDLIPGVVRPGVRVPGCFDPFEMAVRAVLGQQVTVKAARTIAGRVTTALGNEVTTPFEDLTRAFPLPETIVALEGPIEDRLGPLGVTGVRARSILAIAQALTAGTLTLSHHADPEKERETLLALPGIGPWTVDYIAMRALGWPDAFLDTDYGVKKALSAIPPKDLADLSRAWSPWRSYATITLWNFLQRQAAHETNETEAS